MGPQMSHTQLRYADAEHYYRRALEGFLRTLGPEHKESYQLRVDGVNGDLPNKKLLMKSFQEHILPSFWKGRTYC